MGKMKSLDFEVNEFLDDMTSGIEMPKFKPWLEPALQSYVKSAFKIGDELAEELVKKWQNTTQSTQ